MLHIVREHKSSWVIWIILGVICFVFVFFGVEAVVSGPGVNTVAVVGETSIEPIEVLRAEFNLVQFYRNAYKDQFTQEVRESMKLRDQALNGLIDRAVLVEQARELGLEISDDELRDVILGTPAFQRDGRFDKEQYMRALRGSQRTPAEYEEAIRRDLAVQRLQQLVEDGASVSEQEARDHVLAQEETRTFEYVKFPTIEFEEHVDVDDEDGIEATYEENKTKYASPETVQTAMLVFTPEAYASQVAVSDEEVESIYDQFKGGKYTQPHEVSARHVLVKVDAGASDEDKAAAREKIEAVQKRLADGEDFAAVATEVSEDVGSAAKGGDLGYFGKGRMVPPFEEAAFALEPGGTSDIVESPFGFHIIRVEDVREERMKPFDEVRDEIVAELREKGGGEKAKEAADAAFAELGKGKSFDEVATEQSLTIETPEPFAKNAPIAGVGRSFPLTNAIFDLEPGSNTDVTSVENNWVIARLDEKIPSVVPPLEEVRSKVVEDFRRAKAQEAGEAAAGEFLAKAKELGSLEKAAQAEGRTVETSQSFSRQGPYVPGMGVNQELKDAVFALSEAKPVADETFAALGDTFVVGVGESAVPADDEMSEKIEESRTALLRQTQQELFQRYVAELKAKAKVEINRQVLDSLGPV